MKSNHTSEVPNFDTLEGDDGMIFIRECLGSLAP